MQHKVSLELMWQAQAAPAAHKRSSDPGMKREGKVKLAGYKDLLTAHNNTHSNERVSPDSQSGQTSTNSRHVGILWN